MEASEKIICTDFVSDDRKEPRFRTVHTLLPQETVQTMWGIICMQHGRLPCELMKKGCLTSKQSKREATEARNRRAFAHLATSRYLSASEDTAVSVLQVSTLAAVATLFSKHH